MSRTRCFLTWLRSVNYFTVITTGVFLVSLVSALHIAVMETAPRDVVLGDGHELKPLILAMLFLCLTSIGLLFILAGNAIKLTETNRRAQHALDLVREQMHAINASSDGIAILDRDGRYVYVNDAHARCYGYKRGADLIGKSWQTLYSPDMISWFETTVFPELTAKGSWTGVSRGRRIDKTEFPQDVALNMLEDGGFICVVRDITEKIGKEKLLKIIKLAVEAARDGIAITDQSNRLLFMNRSYLNILGYNPQDRDKYINTDWRDMYNTRGREQINAYVLPTTILKGAWSGMKTIMRKDGGLIYADASLTRLPDGTVLGVLRDITERHKSDMEKDELREQIFQSQKLEAIGRLTAGIAHDFSLILTAIQMNAAEMNAFFGTDNPRRDNLSAIMTEAAKARDLVDQMMAFTNRKDVKTAPVELSAIIDDLAGLIEAQLPEKINFVLVNRLKDAQIIANKQQIQQVIQHLCLNAVDALGEKRGKIALTLRGADINLMGLRAYMMVDELPERERFAMVRKREVRGRDFVMFGYLLAQEDYVQITLADTGAGIPPVILDRIFEPFFTTKPLNHGAGLGLSTVHGILVGLNAAMIVDSIPDEGTSFHIFMPRIHNSVLTGVASVLGNGN